MLQHNPHFYSIVCTAQGVTLDGHETREVPEGVSLPCDGCGCVLMTDPEPERETSAKADKPSE